MTGDEWTDPDRPPEPAAPPPRSGSGKGIFGCLGCFGIIILLVIVVPIALAGIGWYMLPRVMAPSDTEWVMVEPDPERAEEIRGSVQEDLAGLDPGERITIELTEADLNQLLANAVNEQFRTEEGDRPHARFRIEDDMLQLDARIVIPESAPGVPGRLRGQPTGVHLALTPRATGDAIVFSVEDVRFGRIPLPVGMAMGILAGTEAGANMPFLDPASGDLRMPLSRVAAAEGMTLHDLTVRGGSLRLEVSR